jgi:hypothetical protein
LGEEKRREIFQSEGSRMSPIVQFPGALRDEIRNHCYDKVEFKLPKSYYPTPPLSVMLQKFNMNTMYGRFGKKVVYQDSDSVFTQIKKEKTMKEMIKQMVKEIGKDKALIRLAESLQIANDGFRAAINNNNTLKEQVFQLQTRLQVHQDYLAVMKGNLR